MTVISQNIVRDADDEPREIPVASLMVFRTQYLVERLAIDHEPAVFFLGGFVASVMYIFKDGTVA